MLQDTLLRRTSRVFSAALNNEHLGEGDKGVLKFPEDDVAAWKLLVFSMFEKKLPEEDLESEANERLQLLLVQCWVLGDKYDIPEFQDLAILELLHHLSDKHMTPEAAEQAAANTSPPSELRMLAAREVARCLHSIESYSGALSVHGFAAEVIELIGHRNKGGGPGVSTFIGRKDGWYRTLIWKGFMVGSGPEKHWIHNDHSDAAED